MTIPASLSDTFAEIVPGGLAAFIVSRLAGMLASSHPQWRERVTAAVGCKLLRP
jgi:hypothetical protein